MPKLSLEAKTEQKPETKLLSEMALSTGVIAALEARLSTYASLKTDRDLLQEQMDEESKQLGAALAEMGISNARTADETVMYWTRGSRTNKLDKGKLIAQGVTMAQIEEATTSKPKKDSFTIRPKGQKSTHDEE